MGETFDIFENAKNLYQLIIINKFSPLTFTHSLKNIVHKLEVENNVNIDFYLNKYYEMGVIVLLKQLSLCYKSISWQRFKELTFNDGELTDIELERIITFSVYYGNICCRISHANKLITFYDNNLESEIFCNSIVELNGLLIKIKNANKDNNANDNIQRHNVFNQIRNQISAEHGKIQNRLEKIKRTQRNEILIKRQEERKKNQEKEKEKQIQKIIEEKEKDKVKESKNNQMQNQQNKEEKKKKQIDAKKKWNQILGNSPSTNSATNSQNALKPNIKTKHQTPKLLQIQNQENLLKREIEREIERKDGNLEDAQDKMRNLEKLQKKKQKKILEIEKVEYDHFCRASRKYLISNIKKQIEHNNETNIKQQRFLYKQQNKENKEKHFKKIAIRDRLREIKEKHISKFLEIVKKEQHQKKQKKQKKDSKKKPKKDININANIKEQKRKQQQQQPPPTKPKVAVPATKKKYVSAENIK